MFILCPLEGKKSHFWSGSSARMNAAAFPLNYFVKIYLVGHISRRQPPYKMI